ncbi:MAG: RiPP maturation radical SAM C-methyltransferase [Lachnospiraceae bacterium]|nr:RiPP maturation radical SAM C-methyltransferase [Lachnospiraceae bacterium]
MEKFHGEKSDHLDHIKKRSGVDVYLVNVPPGVPNVPSLAFGILKPAAQEAGLSVKVLYANFMFANFIGMENYLVLDYWANVTLQLVEIIFQPYAGYSSYATIDEIEDFFLKTYGQSRGDFSKLKEIILKAWEHMDEYLDSVCERILADDPGAVGCSYGLQQANACFAILKRIREKRPDIVTFMGGSCCGESAGQAIVDHMPQVDYVFCGESDDVFGPALKLMLEGNIRELRRTIPCVLTKGGEVSTHAMAVMDDIPYPDHDDFFLQFKESGMDRYYKPVLPMESSRGCWWGCKKKCNFCGLHNSPKLLEYRKKKPVRTAEEMLYLSERYNTKEFIFSDCILDMNDIKEFPKLFGDRGYGIYAEIKSNMSRYDLDCLKQAGFIWLQPGIESIQDDILCHINKGNRAIKHIEMLKYATTIGLTCFWNMMTGFPKEDAGWYEETMEIMPLIHHLHPPKINTFVYQRNSYFTTHREEYGVSLHKADFYEYYFGKDREFLEDFAEFFEDPERKMPYHEKLEVAINEWNRAWNEGETVTYFVDRGFMGVFDNRSCAPQKRVVLTGLKKSICQAAESVISRGKLYEALKEYGKEEIDTAIAELKESKLLLQIKDELLFLALPKEKIEREKKKVCSIATVVRAKT